MIMLDGLPSMPCRNTPLQQCNLIKNIMAHMCAISTVGYSDPWHICVPLAEDRLIYFFLRLKMFSVLRLVSSGVKGSVY